MRSDLDHRALATSVSRPQTTKWRSLLVCNTVSMRVRFAVLAALAAFVVLILLTGSPTRLAHAQLVAPESSRPAARVPPPPTMFSPLYGESSRDILNLEESDVARLEHQLVANPNDFPTRLKLMGYHQRADRAGRQGDRTKRVQHALWLIEHHPDSELLHSPVSRFSPGDLTPADYRRAATLGCCGQSEAGRRSGAVECVVVL
ncbi:MAG: hypothetical protein JWO80_443 [Bryobacterales bacterium]|nr:hypothetical protein [Bryobacterales bacterium]